MMLKSLSKKQKALLGSTLTAVLVTIVTLVGVWFEEEENVLGEQAGDYVVTEVVDGDTVKVEKNGLEETVRLIGVDTPEIKHPRKEVQCFAQEASNKAKELLLGKRVSLSDDPSQYDRDRYDRLLRYVYLEDGTLVNEVLIKEGYAYEYTYQTKYSFQEEFRLAEEQARDEGLGLWGATCR